MATNDTDILMVAAIDFGTTYSGFAYSYKGEYDKNKLDIYANQIWNSGGKQFMSQKTPTCILLNKDKEFESFGFDAENQYADIIIDGEADDYYFFDRFKMMLHTREDISKDMEISDVRGRSLPAIDVFSAAIGALRQYLMNQVEKRGIHLRPDEIKWVLTVPAMWTDKAKEFMRESAEQAEIRKDRLSIALEPEAASIYCQHLPPDKLTGAPEGFSISDNDTKYLVVDIGGGTVDITAHHKVGEDDLQELCSASGGACGGTTVDKEYLNLYEAIVGERVMETLPKDHTVSYLDLLREFETVKRNITESKRQMINFTIPLTDLNALCERFLEKDFKTAIRDSEYQDKIAIVGDKMRMNKELMLSLFETTKVNIIREIQNVLEQLPTTNLKTFLLVGGFSECQIIQDAIKLAFPDTQILIPEVDAGLAVVKGAVLFGHKPDFITSRITQYTYGRRIRPIFDESKHDPQKRVEGENADRCLDVFETFMKKNKSVPVDTIVKIEYHTVKNYQSTVSVAIYFTKKNSANYVDDQGCKKLCEFPVDIPKASEERRYVDVEFRFGSTELQVTATERKTQEKTSFNFIIQSDTVQRTVDEVQKQYANIKQRAKEKSDAIRRPKTGGGPKPPSPSLPELEVLHNMEDMPTLYGLTSGHDTENVEVLESFCGTVLSTAPSTSTGNDIQIQIGEDGIHSLPSFTQQLDFSSTKTSKRRKTMEEEEILTLRAEREKYLQEAEFYKTKTAYIKMKIKLLNSET